MRTNVRFFIFFLGTIKVTTVAELLTQTIIKFDPFETGKILSVQHFNTSNVTSTHINFPNVNVKIREKRQRQFFTDNNFLDQRIRGNVVPQCPCVIKPGTDKCIAYDSRYQAASIEEALVAFQDLTMDDDSLRYPTSGIINTEIFMCRKLECQTCAAILLRRMKQIGMVPQNQQVSIPLPRIIDPRNCRRLRFPKSSFVPNPPQPSYYMNALIERGLRYAGLLIGPQRIIYPPQRNRFWPQAPPRPITSRIQQQQQLQLQQQQRIQQLQQQQQQFQSPFLQPPPQDPIQQPWDFPPNFGFTEPIFSLENEALFPTQFGALEFPHKTIGAGHLQPVIGETITASRTKKKVKRRADPPILGKRYMISCVRRGEADDDNMLALCNACWTWRKLPADYFPPLLNELVCSTENEGHCLSGWGKCHQKYRNFDVLRKVNGNWQPTTISTATCCDCRIRAGTEIHPLVVGKNQN